MFFGVFLFSSVVLLLVGIAPVTSHTILLPKHVLCTRKVWFAVAEPNARSVHVTWVEFGAPVVLWSVSKLKRSHIQPLHHVVAHQCFWTHHHPTKHILSCSSTLLFDQPRPSEFPRLHQWIILVVPTFAEFILLVLVSFVPRCSVSCAMHLDLDYCISYFDWVCERFDSSISRGALVLFFCVQLFSTFPHASTASTLACVLPHNCHGRLVQHRILHCTCCDLVLYHARVLELVAFSSRYILASLHGIVTCSCCSCIEYHGTGCHCCFRLRKWR